MTQKLIMVLLPVILLFLFSACTSVKTISFYETDGCSMFPDRSLINEDDWCDCCETHDFAYWQGGTKEQREAADKEFYNCILMRTGNKSLAELMYAGVRLGGSPYFPTWYRWGYGWNYHRGYAPLSPEEIDMIRRKIEKLHENQD